MFMSPNGKITLDETEKQLVRAWELEAEVETAEWFDRAMGLTEEPEPLFTDLERPLDIAIASALRV